MNDILKDFKAWRKENDLPFNPNFVPRSYESLKDLEWGYWKREDAAVRLEHELNQKAAAVKPPSLPPARPRKARPLIRKGDKPGEILISKQGTFGGDELEALLTYVDDGFNVLAKSLLDLRAKDVAEIQKALDKRIVWRGVWRSGCSYAENDICQDKGGLWVCAAPTSEARPGAGPGWRLMFKTKAGGEK